jgi:hypothetical protein
MRGLGRIRKLGLAGEAGRVHRALAGRLAEPRAGTIAPPERGGCTSVSGKREFLIRRVAAPIRHNESGHSYSRKWFSN